MNAHCPNISAKFYQGYKQFYVVIWMETDVKTIIGLKRKGGTITFYMLSNYDTVYIPLLIIDITDTPISYRMLLFNITRITKSKWNSLKFYQSY